MGQLPNYYLLNSAPGKLNPLKSSQRLFRAIALLCVAMLFLGSVTLCVTPPQPTPDVPIPLQGKQKVIIAGDSITKAGGQNGGFVWLMQRYLDTLYPQQKIELIGAGVSGNTAMDLAARFQADVLGQDPDLVAIEIGTNDALQNLQGSSPNPQTTPAFYRQTLTQLVQAAQSRQIPVILLSPILVSETVNSQDNRRLAEYVAVMQEIAIQQRCQFINLTIPFREVLLTYQRYGGQAQNLLTRDGIHPNSAGHQIIAYTLLKGWGIPEQRLQSLRLQPSR
ncbi:MAG: SGNH/GDSL hydrolase family protein [Oscillatoriales cyanobacterium RM2_1_1]|nr:SGNH/GDSL hydrolase family protein [Oscillatoriales cyanobacterium SM2_3_0]NJO45899.1 SGNH/GDSL hydrolase family protein [Oscillatoriales cyanobacterium RM2_1_1]